MGIELSKKLFLAASLVFFGCSKKPNMQPVNEINEPVFFRANHLAIEVTTGTQVINSDINTEYVPGLLFEPNVYLDANVNEWSSYTFWPLLWNFLLTGEQYSDSSSLKVRKLNISTNLGVNGLGYSQRDGWNFSGGLGIRAKILLTPNIFSQLNTFIQLNDIRKTGRAVGSNEIDIGLQINRKNSLLLSHSITYHKIEERAYFLKRRIAYFDEDINNEFRVGHKIYLGKSHVLGPEIGYGFINADTGKDDYYLIGIKYRYVSK